MTITPKERRNKNRIIATEYVNKINSETFCIECGAQPIEWHHDDHPQNPNARVSSLRTQGASIERIKAEIDKCMPLCRSHHMQQDGRLDALLKNHPYKKGEIYVLPKPCSCCGKDTKPLRNNMCVSCDNHKSGRRVRKTNSCDGCCA